MNWGSRWNIVSVPICEGDDVQKPASSRSFGYLLAGVCVIVAVLSYWAHGRAWLYWGIAAALLLVIAIAVPRLLAPLKRVWLRLGKLLHLVASPLILSTVYFLVFIPTGAIVRLFGKDLLALKRDRVATSYWIERMGGPAPESLKDQF
jgi:hypothetical protein